MVEVFKGDTNTLLRFDVGIDSSLILSAYIDVKKPDDTLIQIPATPIPDTTEIECHVTFDMEGIWFFQPYIELSDWSGYGSIVTIKVNKPIRS